MQIRGSVTQAHLVFVIKTPPALRFHLTFAPATRPAATGVNAISDTPEMDLPVTKCDFGACTIVQNPVTYFDSHHKIGYHYHIS